MLRRLLRALWGPAPTPPPRFRDVLERLDALEGDLSGLRKRVKSLEGQASGGRRSNSRPDEPERPALEQPEPEEGTFPMMARPQLSTAHLARRFKTGG